MKARMKSRPNHEIPITRADYVALSRQGLLVEGSASFDEGDDTSTPFPVGVPAVKAASAASSKAGTEPDTSKEGKDQ